MSIVLFAILGANVNCGAGYWICFAIYCVLYVANAIKEAINEM
jgi:hypothetical protein